MNNLNDVLAKYGSATNACYLASSASGSHTRGVAEKKKEISLAALDHFTGHRLERVHYLGSGFGLRE